MSWNLNRSRERIRSHLDEMGEIEISDLVREADLNALLSETACRRIHGAHVYVDVSNFTRLITDKDGLYAKDDHRRLIRGLHLYQREVARLVEGAALFDGLRVHFQGAKLHALFYRPIKNTSRLATRALLLELVLKDFVGSVFNPAFPDYDDFAVAAGADIGDAIGTRNGIRGDRELLFLGTPANHAAKSIGSHGQLRLTGNIYDALPDDLRGICREVSSGVYQVDKIGRADLQRLAKAYGIDWDAEASAARLEADKEAFPLKEVDYSSAKEPIDLDELSIYNNKRVEAASVFADVTGFTSYIDSADTEEARRSALRVFHAIRKEMAVVIKEDFDGLRIQFQGDRGQGLFHLPEDDAAEISTRAVEAAVGIQSSFEYAIKECLPEVQDLHLAIGVDIGTTLVSKLGTRAHRDRICIGEAVENAAACEERIEGSEIGITKKVLDNLPPHLADRFSYQRASQCYVAQDLTAEKVEWAAKGVNAYRPGGPVFVHSGPAGVTISREKKAGTREIIPSRPYAK